MVALERMRELTLEIILRVVFGAGDETRRPGCARPSRARWHGPLDAADPRRWSLVQRDLGPRQPVGPLPGRGRALRRGAVRTACAQRRAAARDRRLGPRACCSSNATSTATPPSDRHVRDQLVALLVGGHDSSAASLAWAFERLARHPAVHARLRDDEPAYLDAVVKEVLRARPAADDRSAAAARARRGSRGHELPAGVQVAACLWLAMRREDLWPHGVGVRARALARRAASRTRCRGSRTAAGCVAAPARRSPRWRCARCCAPRRSSRLRPARPGAGARAAQHARRRPRPRRRADRDAPDQLSAGA